MVSKSFQALEYLVQKLLIKNIFQTEIILTFDDLWYVGIIRTLSVRLPI